MELGTRRTCHYFVGFRFVRRLLGKQSLHPHARPGTSKYDHRAHEISIGAPDDIRFDSDQIPDRRPQPDHRTPARIGKDVPGNFSRLDRLQATPINLNSPAVELRRSVQVRIEGSSQAANEKSGVFRQIERSAIDLDDAIGNQLFQARR